MLPDTDLSVALLLDPNDDRVFFIMPWSGKTLVGTTDQPGEKNYGFTKGWTVRGSVFVGCR